MIVGVMTMDFMIYDAQSLKDKRRIVQSVKQRIRSRFNVSIAETDYLDAHKRCTLAVAMVSNETRAIGAQFDEVIDLCRAKAGLSLIDYKRTMV